MEIFPKVLGRGCESGVDGSDGGYVQGELEDVGVGGGEVGERGWVACCGY